jgi:hypothetical protein
MLALNAGRPPVHGVAGDRGQALHCAFEPYQAIEQTAEQNIRRQARRIQLPVLVIGGADGRGEAVAATMRLEADDVTPVVLEREPSGTPFAPAAPIS